MSKDLLGFILLIAFRSSSNVKLSVQICRSIAADRISVDPSSFLTFSSSFKCVAYSFISSSLLVGDSPFHSFINLTVLVANFPDTSLMIEYIFIFIFIITLFVSMISIFIPQGNHIFH